MNTKFYQACFTRVDSGNLSAGWQVINTSPDIIQSMVAFFENNEKSNDVSVAKRNADGSPLTVTKVICDAKNIGLTQVQYGLSDNSGRARFFSHGYIFGDSYELLKHPERILSVEQSNFRCSAEETVSAPEALSSSQMPDEKQLMEKYGLTHDKWLTVAKCLLLPLVSSKQTSVFVKTDGSREMALELLYLIYRLVPYSFRTKISASTYAKPSGTNSMYVFTDEIPSVGSYIDPLTGENNIINEAFTKRLERLRFAMYYAERMPLSDEKHDQYYGLYETVLSDMGDAQLNKPELLRLAYMTILKSSIEDDDVNGVLYDWLSLDIGINENVVKRIVKLLEVAIQKNIDLSENVTSLLKDCISKTQDKTLYGRFIQYDAAYLIRLGAEGKAQLGIRRREKEKFADLVAVLRQSTEGNALLNAYYLQCAQQLAESPSCAYVEMTGLVAECDYIADIQKVRDMFIARCDDILISEQRKGKNYNVIYSQYQSAFKEIDPAKKISWERFTDEYDNLFLANFDDGRIKEYTEFYRLFPKYQWSIEFLNTREFISLKKFGYVTHYLKNNCSPTGSYTLSAEVIGNFASRLLDFAIQNDAGETCGEISFWNAFAKTLGCDLAELMAKKYVKVLCDPERLAQSLDTDEYWLALENLEYVYEGCRNYISENKDQNSIDKHTLRLLKDAISAFKKQQKAESKQKNAELSDEADEWDAPKEKSKEKSGEKKPFASFMKLFKDESKKQKKAFDDFDEQDFGFSEDDFDGKSNDKKKRK